jgi:tetratricopeptide (TPR) repeat protein
MMDRSFKKGFKLYKSGKFERAIEKFKKAIVDNPVNADAYNHIGLCYDALGQYGKAIENYLKASEICRHHGDEESTTGMDIHRAESLVAAGQSEEGETILRDVLNTSVRDTIRAQATSILAVCLCNRGRYDEAIDILENARTCIIGTVIEGETFGFGILAMVRGYVEIRKGNLDSAFKYLDIARSDLLKEESAMAELNNYFGEVYMGWGNVQKALEYFQKSWKYMRVHKPSWANSVVAPNVSKARKQMAEKK